MYNWSANLPEAFHLDTVFHISFHISKKQASLCDVVYWSSFFFLVAPKINACHKISDILDQMK